MENNNEGMIPERMSGMTYVLVSYIYNDKPEKNNIIKLGQYSSRSLAESVMKNEMIYQVKGNLDLHAVGENKIFNEDNSYGIIYDIIEVEY